MAEITRNPLTVVQDITEGWTDSRLVDREELTALLAFLAYGENLYSQFGATWTGCSFSQRETTCLLVARREYEGTPQVVFITGRTPTDCVRIFIREFADDRLQWTRDKFR